MSPLVEYGLWTLVGILAVVLLIAVIRRYGTWFTQHLPTGRLSMPNIGIPDIILWIIVVLVLAWLTPALWWLAKGGFAVAASTVMGGSATEYGLTIPSWMKAESEPDQPPDPMQALEHNRILNETLDQAVKANGWEVLRTGIPFNLPANGQPQYTFLNVALMKGFKWTLAWPIGNYTLRIAESEKETQKAKWPCIPPMFSASKSFSVGAGDTAIFIKASAKPWDTGGLPTDTLKVVAYLNPSDSDVVFVRTRMWARPNTWVPWGPLPGERNWHLYVRFSFPEGSIIPGHEIQANRGRIFIKGPSGNHEDQIFTTEYQTSTRLSGQKEGTLFIGIPNINTGKLEFPPVADPRKADKILTEVVLRVDPPKPTE